MCVTDISAEPRMPSNVDRLAFASVDYQVYLEPVIFEHESLRGRASKRPRVFEGVSNRRVIDFGPRAGEPIAVHRVRAEGVGQSVRSTIEVEPAISNSSGERDHRITTPSKWVGGGFDEQLISIDVDRGDAAATLWIDLNVALPIWAFEDDHVGHVEGS